MSCSRTAAFVALCLAYTGADAAGQPLGTFRWQLQPFCNVVTVNVTQQGGIYTLDGTDDRCSGGSQPGSVVGIASLLPGGNVSFGLTTVLPNGTPVHTEATISIASLNGTWRDSAGNNGNFVFTPGAGAGGSPRPIPTGGIAPASITNLLIAPNAVTGANILDGSVTTADLAHPPEIGFSSGEQDLALSATDAVVRTVTVIVPTAGHVAVNATGFFRFNAAAGIDAARCSITTGTVLDSAHQIIGAESVGASIDFLPFAGTRGFVIAAGEHSFNLVCDEFSGDVFVGDTSMTAVFVPTFSPPFTPPS